MSADRSGLPELLLLSVDRVWVAVEIVESPVEVRAGPYCVRITGDGGGDGQQRNPDSSRDSNGIRCRRRRRSTRLRSGRQNRDDLRLHRAARRRGDRLGSDDPRALPGYVGPRPERCDRLSYLRWRSADGPGKSSDADRIFVAQPGIFEGAGAFESIARNTVVAADRRGEHVEFWALDRRSNCLEDHTGVQAALATGSFDTATDYYFHGAEVDGSRFAGYASDADVAWLAHVGLEQTLRDQYDLLRHELPDPQVRSDKVLCGGHSLGGFITGFFAEWDFDGNPQTLDDAGFSQCSGYFALDTVIAAQSPAPVGGSFPQMPDIMKAPLDVATGAITGAMPVLALPAVINPETTNLLALAGLAARLDPEASTISSSGCRTTPTSTGRCGLCSRRTPRCSRPGNRRCAH